MRKILVFTGLFFALVFVGSNLMADSTTPVVWDSTSFTINATALRTDTTGAAATDTIRYNQVAEVFKKQAEESKNQNCQIEIDTCDRDNEYLVIPGEKGCYTCESGKCTTGEIISTSKATLEGKDLYYHKFTCQLGGGFGDDKWVAAPIPDCDNINAVLKNEQHHAKIILNKPNGTPADPVGAAQVAVGATSCIKYVCKKGFKEHKNTCVDENLQLVKSGEEKCREITGTNWVDNNCVCAEVGYKIDESIKRCVLGSKIKTEEKKSTVSTTPPVSTKVAETSQGFICSQTDIVWLYEVISSYPNDAEIVRLARNIIEYCGKDKIEEAQYNIYKGELTALLEKKQRDEIQRQENENKRAERERERLEQEERVRITQISSSIRVASSEISAIQQSLGISVWKNKEGEFNTSRLISDSVAGVVLGTAGGLITSNVIKKSQIRNGFEDMSCTIGGQVVAGWGDEFKVGIR